MVPWSVGEYSRPYETTSVDVNNDSIIDISDPDTLVVLPDYGNRTFASVMLFSTGISTSLYSVTSGGFNNNDRMDIVVANYRRNNMAIFIGNSDGTFPRIIRYFIGYRSTPTYIKVCDFDHYNHLDVAVSKQNTDNIGILYGYGNGTFSPVVLYPTGDGSTSFCLRSGDVNNDKVMDIGVVSNGLNYIMILYGLGDRRFLLGPSYSNGDKSAAISLAIDDFDSEGRLDITKANFLANNVDAHIQYDYASLGGIITYSTDVESEPSSVSVGHFNNDAYYDVVRAK